MTEEGRKFDQDKVRIELFPGDALYAIAQVLTYGAKKYDARNWELGINYSRVFGALQRHLWAWWQGKAPTNANFAFGPVDPETTYSHLWHAGCCLVFLITYEMRQLTNYDDRPMGLSPQFQAGGVNRLPVGSPPPRITTGNMVPQQYQQQKEKVT